MSQDSRHLKRQKIVQNLYSFIMSQKPFDDDMLDICEQIMAYQTQFDSHIAPVAQKSQTENIAPIDQAILYLALYEAQITKSEPPLVIIDEAIRLAHTFGGEHSYEFINAVLAKILLPDK